MSTGLLSGILTMHYLFGVGEYLKEEPFYEKLNIVAGLLIFVTGISNIFLVKGSKKLEGTQKTWIHFFEIKFFLTLQLTPAIKPLQYMLDFSDETKTSFQFWIMCLIMVFSIGIKAFREDAQNNFVGDPFSSKLDEITKKY